MSRDSSYISDLIESAELIMEYISNISYENYYSNSILQDAIIRRLTIIGEVVNRLSDELKDNNPNIPWAKIKGFRNILVHEYNTFDYDLVWNTVNKDIPELITKIKKINC